MSSNPGPSKSNPSSRTIPSPSSYPQPMTRAQKEAFQNNLRNEWANIDGGPVAAPAVYGNPGQPAIQWSQLPDPPQVQPNTNYPVPRHAPPVYPYGASASDPVAPPRFPPYGTPGQTTAPASGRDYPSSFSGYAITDSGRDYPPSFSGYAIPDPGRDYPPPLPPNPGSAPRRVYAPPLPANMGSAPGSSYPLPLFGSSNFASGPGFVPPFPSNTGPVPGSAPGPAPPNPYSTPPNQRPEKARSKIDRPRQSVFRVKMGSSEVAGQDLQPMQGKIKFDTGPKIESILLV
ncbi:hypothetical protein FRB90_004287 [Tulasnella sp. 427]|nr:hypothetical protein FRB90_004287 [Tulasnella sp. 427]